MKTRIKRRQAPRQRQTLAKSIAGAPTREQRMRLATFGPEPVDAWIIDLARTFANLRSYMPKDENSPAKAPPDVTIGTVETTPAGEVKRETVHAGKDILRSMTDEAWNQLARAAFLAMMKNDPDFFEHLARAMRHVSETANEPVADPLRMNLLAVENSKRLQPDGTLRPWTNAEFARAYAADRLAWNKHLSDKDRRRLIAERAPSIERQIPRLRRALRLKSHPAGRPRKHDK